MKAESKCALCGNGTHPAGALRVVHTVSPGLLESAYAECVCFGLQQASIPCVRWSGGAASVASTCNPFPPFSMSPW